MCNVIVAALEYILVCQFGVVQANKLKDLPKTMSILRQIAEEVGLKSIERTHRLMRKVELFHLSFASIFASGNVLITSLAVAQPRPA